MSLLFTLLMSTNSYNMGCGVEPIGPVGCNGQAVCACDANQNCNWIWLNC